VDSDKENMSDDEIKPKKKRRNQLLEIVQQRNAADSERLQKAWERDEKRHTEFQQLQQCSIDLQENLVVGFGKLNEGINTLIHAQEAESRRRIEELERRRKDAERRAAEAERYAGLLQALASNRNN
jgi:hypothetical protein